MTDEAKALVERLRALHVWPQAVADGYADLLTPRQIEKLYEVGRVSHEAADLIETQAREIERLREGHREVFEEWAGSEGFIPETAPEAYLLQLTKRMADIARAALAGDSHDQ